MRSLYNCQFLILFNFIQCSIPFQIDTLISNFLIPIAAKHFGGQRRYFLPHLVNGNSSLVVPVIIRGVCNSSCLIRGIKNVCAILSQSIEA